MHAYLMLGQRRDGGPIHLLDAVLMLGQRRWQ